GDITTLPVDAIISPCGSAVPSQLQTEILGKAGADVVREYAKASRGMNPGDACVTKAGHLPAKFIIHTASPTTEDSATLQ
ncbi:hypothetical protein KIPB_015617, partial [Kipferlia bialata]